MVLTRNTLLIGLLVCIFATLHFASAARKGPNTYGSFIGSFNSYNHGVRGQVYVIDESTFFIKNFTYDGNAPTAYFWVTDSVTPSPSGMLVPYPDKDTRDPKPLGRIHNADIILRLPSNVKIRDIKSLSVWCRRFTVNFGDVIIPSNITIPQPRVLPEFSRLAHGLRSDNITILDSKTFYIPNLHYDGAGPDAYFWVGRGERPNVHGIRVPNEMNSTQVLKGYEGVDIEIVLPGNLTVYDIDWLGVWCVQYQHDFGHVLIPKDLNVPPALGQTKIATSSTSSPLVTSAAELSNCIELLQGRVQVRWELVHDDVIIEVSGRILDDQYVAFGLSGREGRPEMLGADIVVIGYNKYTNSYIAEDYYMSAYAQCDGKDGVCPDHRIGGKNDAVLLNGSRTDGITTVKYKRPVRTNELIYDKVIPDAETTIVAAIGQLNKQFEANAHLASDVTTEDIRIDFGGRGAHQCTNSLYDQPKQPEIKAWPPMTIANEDTFTARIGPTGGKRGYTRITGQPSWGIAWYINDKLIPEITVERGQNITFIVEGGMDKTNPAKYHPFYVTDNPEGGFGQLNPSQQRRQKVFAGVAYDENNYPYPTAAGRYCEYVHKRTDQSEKTETFREFFDTLKLECGEGQPATLEWHVEPDTPDLVYYQCYTHKNLGWKIHVVNEGSSPVTQSASQYTPSIILVLAFAFLAVAARHR